MYNNSSFFNYLTKYDLIKNIYHELFNQGNDELIIIILELLQHATGDIFILVIFVFLIYKYILKLGAHPLVNLLDSENIRIRKLTSYILSNFATLSDIRD